MPYPLTRFYHLRPTLSHTFFHTFVLFDMPHLSCLVVLFMKTPPSFPISHRTSLSVQWMLLCESLVHSTTVLVSAGSTATRRYSLSIGATTPTTPKRTPTKRHPYPQSFHATKLSSLYGAPLRVRTIASLGCVFTVYVVVHAL